MLKTVKTISTYRKILYGIGSATLAAALTVFPLAVMMLAAAATEKKLNRDLREMGKDTPVMVIAGEDKAAEAAE